MLISQLMAADLTLRTATKAWQDRPSGHRPSLEYSLMVYELASRAGRWRPGSGEPERALSSPHQPHRQVQPLGGSPKSSPALRFAGRPRRVGWAARPPKRRRINPDLLRTIDRTSADHQPWGAPVEPSPPGGDGWVGVERADVRVPGLRDGPVAAHLAQQVQLLCERRAVARPGGRRQVPRCGR